MMANNGLIGFPLNTMKQAMHGVEALRMLLLPYDALVSQPAAAVAAVYQFCGLEPFAHDFESIDDLLARRIQL